MGESRDEGKLAMLLILVEAGHDGSRSTLYYSHCVCTSLTVFVFEIVHNLNC